MNTFLTIFNAFPAILGAVQAVETAIPIPQSGQTKLNLVLGAAAAAWQASRIEQQISKSTTLNAVAAIANLSVAELNAAGVFQRSTSVAPVSSN
ncbi:MAG TPA: hypothetical protein VKB79_01670 [Bryobacteraceae bacterium]|nr:hypothetical protein [Bryobacteraceae bacterium]